MITPNNNTTRLPRQGINTMDKTRNTIGDNIRRIRKDKGIKQRELAKKLGVAYQNLSGWERGVRQPSTKYLSKIAEALGVNVESLLYEKKKKQETYFSLKERKELRKQITREEQEHIDSFNRFMEKYIKEVNNRESFHEGFIDRLLDKFTRRTKPSVEQILADNEYLKSRISELEEEVKRLKEEKKSD